MRSCLSIVSLLASLRLSRAYTVSPGGGAPATNHAAAAAAARESAPTRRTLLTQILGAAGAAFLLPQAGLADVDVAAVEMKEFVDPYGIFSITVPTGFFTLRRTAKGDLPDEKTGKGRRGSSIFTAGNMAKAEVIAVERFPTRVLLEENGIEAVGSLATFPAIGEPLAIANLINLRREKDKAGVTNTIMDKDSVKVSADGKVLTFKLKTEIDVQKPDLLMEQYGVSRLFRVTVARASLESSDGNLLAAFASALESDFNGPDGASLQKAVDSFKVVEREFGF